MGIFPKMGFLFAVSSYFDMGRVTRNEISIAAGLMGSNWLSATKFLKKSGEVVELFYVRKYLIFDL